MSTDRLKWIQENKDNSKIPQLVRDYDWFLGIWFDLYVFRPQKRLPEIEKDALYYKKMYRQAIAQYKKELWSYLGLFLGYSTPGLLLLTINAIETIPPPYLALLAFFCAFIWPLIFGAYLTFFTSSDGGFKKWGPK